MQSKEKVRNKEMGMVQYINWLKIGPLGLHGMIVVTRLWKESRSTMSLLISDCSEQLTPWFDVPE